MSIENVKVHLGDRSYPIFIGQDALPKALPVMKDLIGKGQAAIVTDEAVWKLYADQITAKLGDLPVITVSTGEGSKSFATFEYVSDALLSANVGRDGTVIAFGGGVVGDLAGFCAATLRRGCQFIQIPTTLLAQVDSSVGGKTAINSRIGKNLIGAFHQPSLVIADTRFLETLPGREMKAGYAEVLKYGLLGDRAFAAWLMNEGHRVLAREPKVLTHAVLTSVQAKADIVAADEKEAGQRALLNLGHTFGHALEAVMGYSDTLLHGEAVAAGMAMAFRFSVKLGYASPDDAAYVAQHLHNVGLPTSPRDIEGLTTTADEQLNLMYQDKKAEGGQLTLILTRGIGEAVVARNVDPGPLKEFLTEELAVSR